MSERERDDEQPAPLPAYERTWRHPAERAAQERRDYQRAAAPPPLSRRALTYIGALGLVAAIAVLSVAVPKGISDLATRGTDPRTPPTDPTSSVPIKGFTVNPALFVAGSHGVSSALPVGNGHLVAALEDVTSRDEVWITLPTGEEVAADIVAADGDSGLALLRVGPPDTARLPGSLFDFASALKDGGASFDPGALENVRLIDTDGDQHATAADGVSTGALRPFLLVDTPRAVSGVAAVVGPRNRAVGVAVRKAQTTWLIPVAELWSVLSGVFGLTQPGN